MGFESHELTCLFELRSPTSLALDLHRLVGVVYSDAPGEVHTPLKKKGLGEAVDCGSDEGDGPRVPSEFEEPVYRPVHEVTARYHYHIGLGDYLLAGRARAAAPCMIPYFIFLDIGIFFYLSYVDYSLI